MNIFKNIDPFIFLVSLCIGLGLTYVFTPPPHIVYKYPTPFNVDNITYQDDSQSCYKYKANVVSCPANKKMIKPHIIQ